VKGGEKIQKFHKINIDAGLKLNVVHTCNHFFYFCGATKGALGIYFLTTSAFFPDRWQAIDAFIVALTPLASNGDMNERQSNGLLDWLYHSVSFAAGILNGLWISVWMVVVSDAQLKTALCRFNIRR